MGTRIQGWQACEGAIHIANAYCSSYNVAVKKSRVTFSLPVII